MKRCYQRRQRDAQILKRDLAIPRLIGQNAEVIAAALRLTLEDETLFEKLFGEPMPPQLRAGLHAEHELWKKIQSQMSNDQLTIRRLNNINKLLNLQRQMLQTPLVHKYLQAIDRIQRER